MTYKTHILGGILAGLVASRMGLAEGIVNESVIVGVSTFASLIPDIDIEGSKISNRAKLTSKVVTSISGHRGIFHTPILYIVIAFLLNNVLPQTVVIGFLAGVLSHIALDMLNSKGVPIFYPLVTKKISIARIRTRGAGENFVSIVLMGLIAVIFLNIDILGMVKNIDYTTEIQAILTKIEITETKTTIVYKGLEMINTLKDMIMEVIK